MQNIKNLSKEKKDILNEVWLDRPSLPKDKMFIHII